MADQLTNDLQSLRIDREPRPKGNSPFGRIAFWLVTLGALGAAAVYAYPHLEARVFKTKVAVTEVLRISPSMAATSFTSTGYVVARTISRVSTKAYGRVEQVLVHEGDLVQAGQPIVRLDAADQEAQLLASRARVLAAQARVAQARANVAELEQQIRRQEGLVSRGAVGQSTVDDLRARVDALRAAVRAAEAEVRAAQADVEVVRAALAQMTIFAPITGTVMTKPVEAGEVVGPEFELMQIADFSSLVVEIDVPEARLSMVKIGGPCEIVLDAFPGKRYRGVALELGHRVNRAKATVPVKVQITDPMEGVIPDMSARVSFLTEALSEEQLRAAEKIVVPESAVVTRDGRKVVFVIEDGKVKALPVTLGARSDAGFELVEGPDPGTRLVQNPPPQLATGQSIEETTE